MRALADKIQKERAAAEGSKDAARHDENALGQPEEPPAVKAGSRLEVLVLVTCAQDDGTASGWRSRSSRLLTGRPRTRRRQRPARCAS